METRRTLWPEWPPKQSVPALSFSSLQLYEQCPLAWCFQYLTRLIPDQGLKDRIFIEKGLLSSAGLPGTVVHETIVEAARIRRDTGRWPTDLIEIARSLFQRYRDDSLSRIETYERNGGVARGNELRGAIDRDFQGQPWTDDELQRIDADMSRCLGNWTEAGFPEFFDRYPTDHLRLPSWISDTPPWFWLDNIVVYASFDIAVFTAEQLLIIDWKTGSEQHDCGKVERQLRFYAAFGNLYWGRPLDQITVAPVWLSSGTERRASAVSPEALEEDKALWRERHHAIRKRVAECEAHRERYDIVFPPAGVPDACAFCKFRSCPHRSQQPSEAAGHCDAGDPFTNPV